MMTAVIDVTTDDVVPAARLSVFGLMRSPKWQAMSAISTPNTTPFARPSHQVELGDCSGKAREKLKVAHPQLNFADTAPPSSAIAQVTTRATGAPPRSPSPSAG